MTAITILLYGKGLFALYVTGAARSSFLHFLHCDSLVFRRGKVEFDMAISTLIQARMKFVAEFDVSRILQLEIYILGGMTLHTVFRLKCTFTVMAGPTGFPLFHLSHSDGLFRSHIVNFGMTNRAVVRIGAFEMSLVTESHQSRFFDLKGNIRNFMTLDTILEIESPFAVMAGAAGFAFLHIRHGESVLASEIENGIVTCLAVILDAFLPEVLIVAEDDLAEVGYLHGDIFYVNRISEGTSENRHGQDQKRVPLIHDTLLKTKKESPLIETQLSFNADVFPSLPTLSTSAESGKKAYDPVLPYRCGRKERQKKSKRRGNGRPQET